MKRLLSPSFCTLLMAHASHAAVLVSGDRGPSEAKACEGAKFSVKERIAANGKEVKRYGDCTWVPQSTDVWFCKVEGYFDDDGANASASAGEKPQGNGDDQ